MEIIFIARIKNGQNGSWYIELIDPVEKTSANCNDLKEFEEELVGMTSLYDGKIDGVNWEVDDDVSDEQFLEVQNEMVRIQGELKNDSDD